MNRLSVLILLLGAFASLAVAASAPTFCKCTCFTNSTIIEIKPKSSTGSSPSRPPSQHQPPSEGTTDPDDKDDDNAGDDQDALGGADFESAIADSGEGENGRRLARRAQGSSSSPSCSQCNRSFCLSQSLPICRGAADKDVTTMCFQRDSRKDQFIKAVDQRQRGAGLGGIPGIGGGGRAGAGGAGAPPRGRREGGILPLGRGGLGSTGTDGGRGAYAAVAGHSRESSLQTN
ncbi:hypothetical protein INS49_009495 [Diaporthe citri]|uniref:uncharacterized protein n=1 Tax=Diaporthe citri TaxID=83186 RepID=UPI001C7FFD31|nr:uncharacterized protein INS49_009495 [Diaporthe citri]KAG6361270.1 hypothetical protein INS49_009495 [Diaporthe citri]